MRVAHPLLLAAGLGALYGLVPPLILAGGAVLAVVAIALASAHKLRPWTDLAAWAAVLGVAWFAELPDTMDAVRIVALAAAAPLVLAGLHLPPASAPRLRILKASVSWLVVGGLAAVLAWLPVWRSFHEGIFVQDSASPAGVALALVLAAGVLGAVAYAVSSRLRLQGSQGSRGTSRQDSAKA